ncbi:formate-dependent phosphoribosylglycinamide formyltransferase [Nocardioides sp. TRM66260-LWL]|uniref:formate-dependent phosphoribosylglycinamide formyltransferase n=1 Tax=Nocardioides sp. TRM66260-LWL TaxID=2874478 RepID=UPI001CC6A0F1|nr:formate-dependent phosphoribosylglycinamide formyltransferase [Nocardioides sp. TRM66260-LWL]MBZ5733116.1 formate-dependent phosphoribosylglycinamide formyltransferase [Nocardioides sp. TRM66260-LWL]
MIGTPLSASSTTALLLGSGELGKEVVLELQRLGVETVAVDRYADAPAMQVAHRSHVVDMQDADALRAVLRAERPDVVVPEIEAIATDVLAELEAAQEWPLRVAPTARATVLTMNREGIRRLAAEELGLPTSPYAFVDTLEELNAAADELGWPVVLKPVMSSSGKGQSLVRSPDDLAAAWDFAQTGGRGSQSARCIVEGFVAFDTEITLLTARHVDGTLFLDPVVHRQVDGDYAESWQEAPGESTVSAEQLAQAQDVARRITDALGGHGLFGVELFLTADGVVFSEVSPRPHDTGLVTLVSQDVSEFAVHARAVLGLPVAATRWPGAAASWPVKVEGHGVPSFDGLEEAYAVDPSVQVRLFGKPRVDGERRVAVTLARGATTAEARDRARAAAAALRVTLA